MDKPTADDIVDTALKFRRLLREADDTTIEGAQRLINTAALMMAHASHLEPYSGMGMACAQELMRRAILECKAPASDASDELED